MSSPKRQTCDHIIDQTDSSSSDGDKTETPAEVTMEEAIPIDVSERRQQLVDAGLNLQTTAQDQANTHRRGSFAVPSTADEIQEAKVRWGGQAWQMKVLRFINCDRVQRFLVCLLVLDVFILFSELAIDAFFPSCKSVTREAISCCPYDGGDEAYAETDMHRLLGGGGSGEICPYPLAETNFQSGCDYKHPGVHVAHKALFWTTVAILGTFELELLLLIYLIGPKKFCGQLTYIVDLIVVTLSLVLELMFRLASEEALAVLPGILIVFRLWRFVRIGHGLVASTYEVQERKIHAAVEYINELEGKLKKYDHVPKRPNKLTKSIVKRLSTDSNPPEFNSN